MNKKHIPLGGCPRIGFFSQIKAFFDNKRRHTPKYSEHYFQKITTEGSAGSAPSWGKKTFSDSLLGIILLITASFLCALISVNWSVSDLFITLDQRGRLLMAEKEYQEAAKVFRNPLQRGTALYRNGDFKEAAAAFAQDDSVNALYNRANALLMQGKYDDAISGYEQVLALKPDWLEARENLDLAHARKKKLAKPTPNRQNLNSLIITEFTKKNFPAETLKNTHNVGLILEMKMGVAILK